MSHQKGLENTLERLEEILLENFGFEPTDSQEIVIRALPRFLMSVKKNCLFILKGYAGTGKTSIVNAIVKSLPVLNSYAILLAPTGRAAKVLSSYSGQNASTIHRKIYFQQRTASGGVFFVPAHNPHKNALFIVDEASMIGWDDYGFGSGGNLLMDLLEYTYSGKNCKVLMIGDSAQLPPVGSSLSPALDLEFLKSHFELTAAGFELIDVMRQKKDSGILDFATILRKYIFGSEDRLPINLSSAPDVKIITGYELQEELESSFSIYGEEGTVIICRSNKRSYAFNMQVRARVFFRDEVLNAGDYIMAVKNNYKWLDNDSTAGFIANGDIMEVLRIGKFEERYGFHFAHATVRLIDYPKEPELDLVLWLDALDVELASMHKSATDKLYREVSKDLAHIETKAERKKALQNDPFFNALQVKFAYAVTAHKAQGGQWPSVFVDQGYLTEEMIDQEYYRWLYTAVSRATTELKLVNFSSSLILED